MKKVFIKNRQNKRLAVVVEENSHSKGVVFVMHGLGDSKDADHIKVIRRVFSDNSYNVVSFDASSTVGDSEGSYAEATITNYFEDLEDIVAWSEGKEWYKGDIFVSGHSLGAICSLLYAQKHKNKIKGVVAASTVVSGELLKATYEPKDLKLWQEKGWILKHPSSLRPDFTAKLNYSFIEDLEKYSLLANISQITAKILLIVGSEDDVTPFDHQEVLVQEMRKIGKIVDLQVIKGADHVFVGKELDNLYIIIDAWLKNV